MRHIEDAALCRSGVYAVTAHLSGYVCLWNAARGTLIKRTLLDESALSVDISLMGRTRPVGGGRGRPGRSTGCRGGRGSRELRPVRSGLIAFATAWNGVYLWGVGDNKPPTRLGVTPPAITPRVCFAPCGLYLAASVEAAGCGRPPSVWLWDFHSATSAEIAPGLHCSRFAFHPVRPWIALNSPARPGLWHLRDVRTGEIVTTCDAGEPLGPSFAFSTGERFAAAGREKVIVWDLFKKQRQS
jgi:hypothetical protein